MQYTRPVGAGILFALAVLSGVIALVGTAGVWWVKAQLDQTTAAGTALLTGYLDIAAQTIDIVDTHLGEAEQRAEAIRSRAAQLREGLNAGARVEELQRTVNEELAPSLERATDGTGQFHAALQAYDRHVERLNRVPGVQLPRVSDRLDPILARGAELRDQAQVIKGAVGKVDWKGLLAAADQVLARIGDVRLVLARAAEVVETSQTALIQLQENVASWTTVGAAVLTPLLAIYAVGQVGLAVYAWRWMRGTQASPPRPLSARGVRG